MYFAIISGFCASIASLFGKLSGSTLLEDLLFGRILCFCLMLLCNTCVWTFYVKALHSTDSTLTATVASTSANYIFSALFGIVLFNEITTLFWWIGMFLIICGLVLIVRDTEDNSVQELKRD